MDSNFELYKAVGEKIKAFRNLRNLTQTELAELVKINRASISNIEVGRQQISIHLLYKFADVLNAEIFDLLPSKKEVISSSPSTNLIKDLLDEQNLTNDTKNSILELLKKPENDK